MKDFLNNYKKGCKSLFSTLACLFLIGGNDVLHAQNNVKGKTTPTTSLGIHSVMDVPMSQALNINTNKFIAYASKLGNPTQLAAGPKSSLEQLQINQAAGIHTIIQVDWKSETPGTPLPAVGSAEYQQNLATWTQFLLIYGPYIYAVTIDDEPSLTYASSDLMSPSGHSNAIAWFQTLASTAADLRAATPALSHLLIGTPAINWWADIVYNRLTPYDNAFLAWATSDPNIDFIDTHAHVVNVDDMTTFFTYLVQLNENSQPSPKKITATEWSQAPATAPWLKQAPTVSSATKNVAFKNYLNGANPTNSAYITFVESGTNQLDLGTWNAFVATAPLDPKFMKNAFKTMQSFGLDFACYADYCQGGNPVFDTGELYAQKSVVLLNGEWQPNFHLLNWYMAIPR